MSWADLERRLEADAAQHFDGSAFTVKPRAPASNVNSPAGGDLARADFTFSGSIDRNPPPQRNEALSGPWNEKGSAVSFEAVVTARETEAWPYRPRVGDVMVCDGVAWIIADIHLDGSARLALYVNRARA